MATFGPMECFACLLCFVVIAISGPGVQGLEPVTTTIATAAAVGISMLSSMTTLFKPTNILCRVGSSLFDSECCNDHFIKTDEEMIKTLRKELQKKVHGQHLVLQAVIKPISGHLRNKDPKKALVLSFHGRTGGGKNHVSTILANTMYTHGQKSGYVHLFLATLHFVHKEKVEMYKDQLRSWIKGNVTRCPQSLFIFDEVDKMPPGLLDALAPFLDCHIDIDGVDYRKSIFLLLSNTAATTISDKTLEHWKNGRNREDITLKDMEEAITQTSFNDQGGLWHSTLIAKDLISAFIPFLPLERKHIKLCIWDDLIAKGYKKITTEILENVANEMRYLPKDTQIYSTSGCKRVSEKVDLIIEEELITDS